MDLSVMRAGQSSRPRGCGNGRILGRDEREKRRRDNLCFSCGKSGHRAKDCRTPTQRLHMMSKQTAGTPGKKADTGVSTAKKAGNLSELEEVQV